MTQPTCQCGAPLEPIECPDCNDEGPCNDTCSGAILVCYDCDQDVITGNPYYYWDEAKL